MKRKARKNYFRNMLEQHRGKPKAFWDTLRQVLPSKNNRYEIDKIVVDGKELIDKHDIANFLNEYFTTIASSLLASRQSHGSPVDLQQDGLSSISDHSFKFHAVSENDVFKVLRTMDILKATGADSIPAKVIRTTAPYISNIVANLFNASFQCGRLSSIWKAARVTPLFKGGFQTERDNYRPISILPCISKVKESFANNDLQRFAADIGLVGDHQFAYARYSSTTFALIIAVDSWKLAIDKGEKVVCTFLDLRNAFDVIEHATLIRKLSKRGVSDNQLEWFKSYLQGKNQFVSYASADSEHRLITQGVPQGSVLGPTLFKIHINGITDTCTESEVVLYADDTEIHASAKDVSVAETCVNKDLASTVSCWDENGLISNHKKCEAMLIGSKHAVNNTRPLQIVLDGKPMKQCDYLKYLGIYINHCLTWSKHVTYVQSRVYPKKLKLLNRISSFLNRNICSESTNRLCYFC